MRVAQLSFISIALACSIAEAQDRKVQPEIVKFEDWEMICQIPGKTTASGKSCKINQILADKESGQTVFAMTALAASKAGSFVVVVSAPLGGYIVPGMQLTIDKKLPYKLLFETCNVSGCHAGFEIKGRIKDDLITGKQARFKIWTTRSQPAEVSISLAGFARAFGSLKDSGS
jgi:invasion protein IalB